MDIDRVPAQIGFAFAAVLLSLLMGGCGLISHRPPVAETPAVETQQRAQPPPSAAAAPQPESATATGEPAVPATPEPAAAPTSGAPVAAAATGVERPPAPPQRAPVLPESQ